VPPPSAPPPSPPSPPQMPQPLPPPLSPPDIGSGASGEVGSGASAYAAPPPMNCPVLNDTMLLTSSIDRILGLAPAAGASYPAPPPPAVWPLDHSTSVTFDGENRSVVHVHIKTWAPTDPREVDILPSPLMHLLQNWGREGFLDDMFLELCLQPHPAVEADITGMQVNTPKPPPPPLPPPPSPPPLPPGGQYLPTVRFEMTVASSIESFGEAVRRSFVAGLALLLSVDVEKIKLFVRPVRSWLPTLQTHCLPGATLSHPVSKHVGTACSGEGASDVHN
jgi:hypothetical protein